MYNFKLLVENIKKCEVFVVENDVNNTKNDGKCENNTDGQVVLDGGSGNIYCLSIIGQIEGHFVLESNAKSTKA